MFSDPFHVLPRFCPFCDKFQAISRPGQKKFKCPGFPGSAGKPVYNE